MTHYPAISLFPKNSLILFLLTTIFFTKTISGQNNVFFECAWFAN